MGHRRIRKINNRKYKRRRMILLAVIIFLVLSTSILFIKSIINKKSQKKNVNVLVKKESNKKSIKEGNAKTQNVKVNEEKKTNPQDILKGANVTLEGDKYTCDSVEIQNILEEHKTHVDGKKIAFLTFDDGPSTTVTPKILDTLKENDVKATFFIIGNSLEGSERAKEILKRTIKEGHAIGNHTESHNYKHLYPGRFVNANNFMEEVDETERLMKSALGDDFHTRVVRFPGGHMSWKGKEEVDKVMKERNYAYIDWNSLTGDAEGRKKTPEQLFSRIQRQITEENKPDRLVILMHDTYGKENTSRALQNVINHLKSLGYEFRTLK